MSIRLKIILIVVPLLIAALAVAGVSSSFSATTAVTQVAVEFLNFKTDQLEQYIDGQWRILVENDLTAREDMVQAAQAGIEVFASGLLRSDTEAIFALNADNELAMATADLNISAEEAERLRRLALGSEGELLTTTLDGIERVSSTFFFEPFEWTVFATETREAFYSAVDRITLQTILLVVGASVVGAVLLALFVRRLLNPLTRLVSTMRNVIDSTDLSAQVDIAFDDEVGKVSNTFNIMIRELDRAYSEIKNHAYQAVLNGKREEKLRRIFQKYVPQELIDQFFANPEEMLVGRNKDLAILFSDIRSFTTISESMAPADLVATLNRYFTVMVDLIYSRGGVIDKYIGDAIMAMFGAPIDHDDRALRAVQAGIGMSEALDRFNEEQRERGEIEFRIGVGIGYGEVTVGNIGTEQKMDYTVIGDTVNVASRLEGLTKPYKHTLIISQSLAEIVRDEVPVRLLDKVAVKGRAGGIEIYTAKGELENSEREAWPLNQEAFTHYYERRFDEARKAFTEVERLLPSDFIAEMMIERCERFGRTPPPSDWSGVEIMETK